MIKKEFEAIRRASAEIGIDHGVFEKKKGGMHATGTETNGKESVSSLGGSAADIGTNRGPTSEKKKGGMHAAAYLSGKTGGTDHVAYKLMDPSTSPKRKNSSPLVNVKAKPVAPTPVTFSSEHTADLDVLLAERVSDTKRWASDVTSASRAQKVQSIADIAHLSPVERMKEVHTGILNTIETYDTVTKNHTKERERDILLTCQSTIKSVEEVTRRKIAKEYENKINHDGCNIEIRSLDKELKIVKMECSRLIATNDRLSKELANLRRFKVTYETEMQLVLGSIGRLRIRNRILNRKLKAFSDPGGEVKGDEEAREEEEERACDELEWEVLNAETSQRKWNISTLSNLLSSPSTDPSYSSPTRPTSAVVSRDNKDPHAQCKADLAHMRSMFAKEATIKRAVIKECNDRAATAVPLLRLLRACVKEIKESDRSATDTAKDLDEPDLTPSGSTTSSLDDNENRFPKDTSNPPLLFSTRLAQDRRVLAYMAMTTKQASRPFRSDHDGVKDIQSSNPSTSSDEEPEMAFLPADVLPLADLVANGHHEKKRDQKPISAEPLLCISGEHQQPMPRAIVRPKSAPDTGATKSFSSIRFTVSDDPAGQSKIFRGVRSTHQDITPFEESAVNASMPDTVDASIDVTSKDDGMRKDFFVVTGSSISRPSTAKTKR